MSKLRPACRRSAGGRELELKGLEAFILHVRFRRPLDQETLSVTALITESVEPGDGS